MNNRERTIVKPRDFALCRNAECPARDRCLRFTAKHADSDGVYLLALHDLPTGRCSEFAEAEEREQAGLGGDSSRAETWSR